MEDLINDPTLFITIGHMTESLAVLVLLDQMPDGFERLVALQVVAIGGGFIQMLVESNNASSVLTAE